MVNVYKGFIGLTGVKNVGPSSLRIKTQHSKVRVRFFNFLTLHFQTFRCRTHPADGSVLSGDQALLFELGVSQN